MGQPQSPDAHDIQQQALTRLVNERRAEIEAADDPMVGLTGARYWGGCTLQWLVQMWSHVHGGAHIIWLALVGAP